MNSLLLPPLVDCFTTAPFESSSCTSASAKSEFAASEKLGETYDNFLEQKEDGGAELTAADEQLQGNLETLTDAAESLDKRFKEGFFTRGRLRTPKNRTEIASRFRNLANTASQVDRLMAQVQPNADVRQDWKEVRRRWVRIGEILRGR